MISSTRRYHHDAARADRVVRFCKSLRQTKGEWSGRPLVLLPWQIEATGKIFGTLDETDARRYRVVYVSIPRKNGKTTWAAALALYMLGFDGEQGGEGYMVAGDKEQAAIGFGIAAGMVEQSRSLSERFRIIKSTRRIVDQKTGSVLRVVSADAKLRHGSNPSFVLADEVHVWPQRDLWDALQTGRGARRQPLTIALTTAGDKMESLESDLYDYARRVRDGIVDDDRWLPILYEADRTDDWQDEAVWHKANPSIDVTIPIEYLRDEARSASEVPALQNTFKRLYLNIRGIDEPSRYLPLSAWDACSSDPIREEDLEGRTCYGGLDLSSVDDLSAWVLVFEPDEPGGLIPILARVWCPGDGITTRSKRDRVPYDVWARQGHLLVTPGSSIDYDLIKEQIVNDSRKFGLVDAGFDRWGAHMVIPSLTDADVEMVETGMGYKTMSPAMGEMLRLCLSSRFQHGGNPLLRWCVENLRVDTDPAGNVKPTKARSKEKIDPLVALAMAVDRLSRHGASGDSTASVYDNPDYGVRVL